MPEDASDEMLFNRERADRLNRESVTTVATDVVLTTVHGALAEAFE